MSPHASRSTSESADGNRAAPDRPSPNADLARNASVSWKNRHRWMR